MPTFDLNEAATNVQLADYVIARTVFEELIKNGHGVQELDRCALEWVGIRRKYVTGEFDVLVCRAGGENRLRVCPREVPCAVLTACL